MPVGINKISRNSQLPDAILDSVVSTETHGSTFSSSDKTGLVLKPSNDWPDIDGKLSSQISGSYDTASVHKFSDGSLVGSVDVSNVSPGDSFAFGVSLSGGVEYAITLEDADGAYQGGYYNGPTNGDIYPIQSPDGNLTLTGSIEDGNLTSYGNKTHAYSFQKLGDII